MTKTPKLSFTKGTGPPSTQRKHQQLHESAMKGCLAHPLRQTFYRIVNELNAQYEPDERLAWPVTYDNGCKVINSMPRIWFEGGALECIVMAEMTKLFQRHNEDVCFYLANIMAIHFCKQLVHDVHAELWQMTQESDMTLIYGIDAEAQENVVWANMWRLLVNTDINQKIAVCFLEASIRRALKQ